MYVSAYISGTSAGVRGLELPLLAGCHGHGHTGNLEGLAAVPLHTMQPEQL